MIKDKRNKRIIKNIGLFSPRHWFGLTPNASIYSKIYYALKRAGFRETVWQIVYSGQLAGIVFPLDKGTKEIHVRFFSDVIEAELEVGRYYLQHFKHPRNQAESLILNILNKYLSEQEMEEALSVIRQHNDPCEAINLKIKMEPRTSILKIAYSILAIICLLGFFEIAPSGLFGFGIIFTAFLQCTLFNRKNNNLL